MTSRAPPVVVVVDDTASTQDDARAAFVAGCAHGTAVLAKRQHRGRGRRGRSWFAGEHGLWLSVVLHIDVPLLEAPRVPIAACVAITDVLRAHGAGVFIKWPNDLLVPAADTGTALGPFRKAGGLIVEAVDVADGRLKTCILGVGINLTDPAGGFPADVTATAGTLASVGYDDDGIERTVLAEELVAAVMTLSSLTNDNVFFDVLTAVKARSATLGRNVVVDGIAGRAIDFEFDGALVLLLPDGRRHIVRAGDVAIS